MTDVIEAIGKKRLMALTGRGHANVSNWIAAGNFPPDLRDVMRDELRRLRVEAPRELWRQRGNFDLLKKAS